MRILLINYEYPPLGGGAGNATANLARCMALKGHNVCVITSRFGDAAPMEWVDGYQVRRIAALRRALDRSNPLEMLSFTLSSLWAVLWNPHPTDCCIAFFGIPSGPAAWLLKMRTGTPYLVSLRGGDVPGFQPYDLKTYHRLTRPLIRFIWWQARHLVANSQGLAALAQRTAPKRQISVIPNGVDTQFYSPLLDTNEASGMKWMFAGRLRMQHKGLHHLIEAVARLPQELRTRLSITLVGDGPDRDKLEQQMAAFGVRSLFTFTGWVDKTQIRDYYRQHDGLILPSQDEGMPNVVLEAMACGLPIIATATSGTSELIQDNGWLVMPGQVDALAQALEAALQSPKDGLLQMGKCSRSIAETYSWDRLADEYLRLMSRSTPS